MFYVTTSLLVEYVPKTNPNIIVALIAGTVTVLGYFITRYFERKRIIEQQIREQKLPVYEEFITFLFNVILGVKKGNHVTEQEMENFMIAFNKKSIIWLSDESLLAYLKWKSTSNLKNKDDMKEVLHSFYALEEMFLEFRKDIGHSNKGLKQGDLLSLFINDLEELQKN